MEFFKNIGKSIYNKKYYSDLLARPFSYSFKYYLLLSLLLALIGTAIFSFTGTPKLKSVFDLLTEKTLQTYPEGLVITIKGGKASTNVQEPYSIKVPEDWKNQSTDENNTQQNFDNILVIDTKSTITVENFQSYKTLCVLTEKNLICSGKDKSLQINSIANFPDTKIDKSLVSSSIDKIKPFFKLLYPIAAIFVFIGTFLALMFNFIYLLLGALFIWIVAKIKKTRIGYKKSYQLGLHLVTAPIVVDYLFKFASSQGLQLNIPYLFSIVLVIIALVNLEAGPSAPPAENPKPV